MTTPTLLNLPAELKRQIWQLSIVSTRITICDVAAEHHLRQSCTDPRNHRRPLRNPNLSILLINKQVFEEVAVLIPRGVCLHYSSLSCARAHLSHKPKLHKRIRSFAVNEFTSVPFGRRKLFERKAECEHRARKLYKLIFRAPEVQRRAWARSTFTVGISNRHCYRFKTVVWIRKKC